MVQTPHQHRPSPHHIASPMYCTCPYCYTGTPAWARWWVCCLSKCRGPHFSSSLSMSKLTSGSTPDTIRSSCSLAWSPPTPTTSLRSWHQTYTVLLTHLSHPLTSSRPLHMHIACRPQSHHACQGIAKHAPCTPRMSTTWAKPRESLRRNTMASFITCTYWIVQVSWSSSPPPLQNLIVLLLYLLLNISLSLEHSATGPCGLWVPSIWFPFISWCYGLGAISTLLYLMISRLLYSLRFYYKYLLTALQ